MANDDALTRKRKYKPAIASKKISLDLIVGMIKSLELENQEDRPKPYAISQEEPKKMPKDATDLKVTMVTQLA